MSSRVVGANSVLARNVGVGATVAALLILSGCSSAPPELPGVAGMPSSTVALGAELTIADQQSEVSTLVAAYAAEKQLTLVTVGSESCPLIPKVGDVQRSMKLVDVELTELSAEFCTADLSPRTFVLDVPYDLTGFTVQVVRDTPSQDYGT